MAASESYSQHKKKSLNTCSDHEHMEIERYCRTCKKPVYTKCVKGVHRDHDWDTMACIAKELRKQTRQEKILLESVLKSISVGTEDFLNAIALAIDNELEENCSALESKRKGIVDFVNKSFDEMKSHCTENHKLKMEPIKERRNQLEMKMKRITFLIQNIDTEASYHTDSDFMELHDEVHQILNELQALSELPEGQRERMVYSPGRSNITTIVPLLGTLELVKLVPEATFENEIIPSDTSINSIHLMSESEAWIHPTQTTINNIVDISGTVKHSVDLGCLVCNFTITNDGKMYFSDFETNTIKEIDKEGNIKSLFSTSPLIPLYIHSARSGDVIITLVDELSFQRNSTSRRLFRRTSMAGNVIKEYEYDKDGETLLFCYPLRPVEHVNGNICVINEYKDIWDNNRTTVYGLHFKGDVIFEYRGTDKDCRLAYICFDKENNILISDLNRKVHILDPNGKFLRFLLTEVYFKENPFAISIFGSKLWIGSTDTGLVKVFKYIY